MGCCQEAAGGLIAGQIMERKELARCWGGVLLRGGGGWGCCGQGEQMRTPSWLGLGMLGGIKTSLHSGAETQAPGVLKPRSCGRSPVWVWGAGRKRNTLGACLRPAAQALPSTCTTQLRAPAEPLAKP